MHKREIPQHNQRSDGKIPLNASAQSATKTDTPYRMSWLGDFMETPEVDSVIAYALPR